MMDLGKSDAFIREHVNDDGGLLSEGLETCNEAKGEHEERDATFRTSLRMEFFVLRRALTPLNCNQSEQTSVIATAK